MVAEESAGSPSDETSGCRRGAVEKYVAFGGARPARGRARDDSW
jgi:hypothetical protein